MATALVPEIGYDKAAALAKEAYRTGRTTDARERPPEEKSGLPRRKPVLEIDAARTPAHDQADSRALTGAGI